METLSHKQTYTTLGVNVIRTEIEAITALIERVDHRFEQACDIILNTSGRIVVIGMGKSGHIANKIAATLASTGTPAFFVHPSEASHGDLGMIINQDTVITISNSGETKELLTILPLLQQRNVPIISLCGRAHSSLVKAATVNLDVSVSKEACPLGLAPTSSTTATLVMGDALAISLLHSRGFSKKDFAHHHPGGTLGKQLLLTVADIMHTDNAIPYVYTDSTLKEALIEMNKKRLGMTTVIDSQQRLVGIFTDGDMRRALDRPIDIHNTTIDQIMTAKPTTISKNMLATEALDIMKNKKITVLIITDHHNTVQGVIHIHDILKVGIQ